jgi:hypothetical protein
MISVGTLGCAVPPIVPIDASHPAELAPNEGLLILHIDTEIPLTRLILSRRIIARSLAKGRHVWIARALEGSYSWEAIEIENEYGRRLKYTLDPDEELTFEVEAGKINYPGELSIRSGSQFARGNEELIVRNRNHSAMAVRELEGSYDSILRSLPLHYAGSSGDGFLEYYTQNRRQRTENLNGATSPGEKLDSQSEAP